MPTTEDQAVLASFEYQKPTEVSVDRIIALRDAHHKLAEMILAIVPKSRERSAAITKLEESSMWTNKAIVMNQ